MMPDGSFTDGFMCDEKLPPRYRCAVCKAWVKAEYERWREANGGEEGLRSRAELANAYAVERSRFGLRVGQLSAEDLRAIYVFQDGECGVHGFCDVLPDGRWEIDHILPISRGGRNTIENIQLLCVECNKDKGNRTNKEWERGLPARFDEWKDCPECGVRIRACYALCYTCRYGD